MTTQQRFQNFPPILVRLLARKRCRPLTNTDIANASGLNIALVDYISKLTAWDLVHTLDAFAFLAGCGLAIDDTKAWRRALDYLSKNPTFRYLRLSPDWLWFYRPMMAQWRGSCGPNKPNILPAIRDLLIRLNPLLK